MKAGFLWFHSEVTTYINRMVLTFLTTDKRKLMDRIMFPHSTELPIGLQRHSN